MRRERLDSAGGVRFPSDDTSIPWHQVTKASFWPLYMSGAQKTGLIQTALRNSRRYMALEKLMWGKQWSAVDVKKQRQKGGGRKENIT